MIISELLSQKSSPGVITISPDTTLMHMSAMIAEHNIGVLIVFDRTGSFCGIVSERDIARAIMRFPRDVATRRVHEIMTSKVITCSMEDEAVDVLDIMNEHGIRHVPVLENGALKAVLSIREFNVAYQRLQEQTRTDYMTGLANRRYFMETFEQELNRRGRFGTPLSVVTVDIDRFKAINDTCGHAAGDAVICAIGQMMVEECRIYDTVGRMGGEEYAILCPNTDLAGATVMCNRILRAIRGRTVEAGGRKIRFTASFGLYETTAPGETAETILANADALLYRAKREGRDRMVSGTGASTRAGDATAA